MVLALRIGLRWDEILRIPIRSILSLIEAEAERKSDYADEVAGLLSKNPKLQRVFDVGGLL